jgi:hypothetical protein
MDNPVSFTLDLPEEYAKLHPTFHVSALRLYRSTDELSYPGRDVPPPPPPPVELRGEGERGYYIVDKILKKRLVEHGKQSRAYYLVSWANYPDELEHTWEPKSNIARSATLSKMLSDFNKEWNATQATPTITRAQAEEEERKRVTALERSKKRPRGRGRK